MTTNINKKRLVIRLALVALLVLLCFVLYYIGKEHEVLLDNKNVTIEGREYQEIYAGDRDVVKLKGPSHTLKISVINEDTEEVTKTVEYKLSLRSISSTMYSLPAIVESAPNAELPLPNANAVEESSGGDAQQETIPSTEAPVLSD